METITVITGGAGFTKSRWELLQKIVNSGKVARFWYGERQFYKDVNNLTLDRSADEAGDLRAFRQSGGKVPFVCWNMPDLELEEVDQ
jgi:hypothetical protein